MYQPAHHREDRLDVQHELIITHSLGLLISAGGGGFLAEGETQQEMSRLVAERGGFGTKVEAGGPS